MNLLHSLLGIGPHTCPWWFEYVLDNPLRRRLHEASKIVGPYVRKGDTVVDIGCGFGIFTLPLAEMVGPQGRVIAVDLQEKMLDHVRERAQRRGLADRIELRQALPESLDVTVEADFVNAFWMFHEVSNKRAFLAEVRAMLRPSGRFLITEPKGHVPKRFFERIVQRVGEAGFSVSVGPKVRFSRSIVCVPHPS